MEILFIGYNYIDCSMELIRLEINKLINKYRTLGKCIFHGSFFAIFLAGGGKSR
jgi:hypothetical protein